MSHQEPLKVNQTTLERRTWSVELEA